MDVFVVICVLTRAGEYFLILVIASVAVWLIYAVKTWIKRVPATELKPKPQPQPKPQFTTELEALIAIEANTRQALELLRQQNKKSFWSMLFLGSIASSD